MALPPRRKDTVYLDPVVLENAESLHKQLSAQKMVSPDPATRLSGASAFSPQEQHALRGEIKSALAQHDMELPLDLPPLSDEEQTYLSPNEQRNAQLKRALSLRGVAPLYTAPQYGLPLEQRLAVENTDLERMLRNDTGPRTADSDAVTKLLSIALMPIAAADEAIGELVSPSLPKEKKVTPLGVIGSIFNTTEAATATVLAAETTAPKWLRAISPGLEAVNTIFERIGEHTRVAQKRQLENLRKQVEDKGAAQIFTVPADASPVVAAYRVTDYPTAIKPLISMIDPAGLFIGTMPAKEAGKLLQEQKLVFDHLTGQFVRPELTESVKQGGFVKLPFGPSMPSAQQAVVYKSFDATLPERLDMAEKLDILKHVPRLMPEAEGFDFSRLHRTLAEKTEAELAKLDATVFGRDRVLKTAPGLLRDLTLGDSVTDAMNTVALYRNWDDWFTLAEKQHAGWFQRVWRRTYTDADGNVRPYTGILRAVHQHRFSPEVQTAARMYVHGTTANEVLNNTERFGLLKKFLTGFPDWDTKASKFKFAGSAPVANSVGADRYEALLQYADSKGWLQKPIDFYRVLDAYQHPEEWTIPKSGRQTMDYFRQRLDENWAIERRQAGFETEDAIEGVYLPQIWKNVRAYADFDELGTPVFPREPSKLRFNAKEAFTKERHFPSVRAALTSTINETIMLDGGPKFENKVMQFADDIEQPTDLFASRLASGRKQIAKSVLLQDLKRLGLKSGDQQYDQILGVLSGKEPAGVITRGFDEVRALLFGLDMGLLGVQVGAGTVPYLVTKPAWTVETYFHALQTAFTDPQKWLVANQERLLRAKRAGMTFAILAKDTKGKPLVERIGGEYNPVAWMNNLQFGRILPAVKLDFFEMNAELLAKGSSLNNALGRKTGLPVWEADRRAAAFTNMMFGGLNQADFLFGPGVRDLMKIGLMTPQFTQSTLQTFLRAGKFGPDGALARAFFIRLFAATGALVAANAWQQHDTNDLKQRLTDPDYPDWMTLRIGDVRVSPLFRYRPLARLVLGGTEDAMDRVIGDNDAVRTKTRALDYYLGRASLPVVLGAVTGSQKNFIGDPEFTQAGPTLRTRETWSVLGKTLARPIGIGQVLDDWKFHRLNATNALASFFGINSYTLDPTREQTKRVYRETLADILSDATVMGRDVVERGDAAALAHDAVTRSRPFDVFARDGKTMDVFTPELKRQVLEQVAARMSFVTPNGDLDTALAARLGEAEKLTAQETKSLELGQRELYFKLREESYRRRREAYTDLEAALRNWPPRLSLDQALEQLALVDATHREALGMARELVAPILEKYKSKRIEPSERQVLFEEWQNTLDSAVRSDGTTDWVTRRQLEQSIERALGPDERRFWAEFNDFRSQHEEDYPAIKQLRDYYIQVLEPYYDLTLPVSVGGMVPDDLHEAYTAWDAAKSAADKQSIWSQLTPQQQSRLGPVSGVITQRQDLLRRASPEVELALWWLYNSLPRYPKAQSLVTRYSRGTFNRLAATDAALRDAAR